MSPAADDPSGYYVPIFVARQPVFDRRGRIWGYELLFRASAEARAAVIDDPDVATATVISDGVAMALEGLREGRKLLINFPRNLLLSEAALALPADICVVEILETVAPEPEIVEACRVVKEQGYALALDDFVGEPGYEPFLELADIVKVDVLATPPERLEGLVKRLGAYNCSLLAEKVETRKGYDRLREMGFTLFQGYFFSRPEIVPGRTLSANMTAKLQLLQELAAHEFEVPALAGIIAADVSLSYKLLTYINSVAFGLKRTVSSINQAVALLGRQPLKQWLMVVLLSDINPAPRGEALTFSAIQRGKFLEELGQEGGLEWPAETLFILGLFSNLDALLDQPMQDILQKMPIEPEVADALLGRSSRLGPLLELALAIESGGFDRAEALLAGLGLDPARAAVLHSRAATWAKGLLASEDAA